MIVTYILKRLSRLGILVLVLASTTFADIDVSDMGGSVKAMVEGKELIFPVLKTDIETDIQGDLATVKVVQTFMNPTNIPLHASYLFPMNKDSAVFAMQVEVGDELVKAKIKKIEEAQQVFNQAKSEGKAAALLKQHRPNMFTQDIANLMPGLPVKVTMEYVQFISKVDGYYELVIPLIVGPRYQPQDVAKPPEDLESEGLADVKKSTSSSQFGTWEIQKLPDYPDVAKLNIPDVIENDRVSIQVRLNSAWPVEHVLSQSHELNVRGSETRKKVSLARGRTIDNQDFVLRYQLSSENTQAGLLTHDGGEETYFSLLLEPPAIPAPDSITPRELVFVLDTSGSMSGEPLSASKVFMKHALKNLNNRDYFRIIGFSNNAKEFTRGPVPATSQNLKAGLAHVNSLRAGGGTEVRSAIEQAFGAPVENGVLRIVVFLTDGYIGNEADVIKLINQKIGNARIYSFGVGTSVNRYLLSEMGRAGRGFARYIDPTEDPEEVAIEFASKLEAPVLTDIKIDWGKSNVKAVTPNVIPDLFAGDSIRIQGKLNLKRAQSIKVTGKVNGALASLPLAIQPADEHKDSGKAIKLVWARSTVADYMHQLTTPEHLRSSGASDNSLKSSIVTLGLEHSLMTRWTSFVAVSEKVVNHNPGHSQSTNVPLPMVKGVSKSAYGNFSGSSAPEPSAYASLLVITSVLGYSLFRRRRQLRV